MTNRECEKRLEFVAEQGSTTALSISRQFHISRAGARSWAEHMVKEQCLFRDEFHGKVRYRLGYVLL